MVLLVRSLLWSMLTGLVLLPVLPAGMARALSDVYVFGDSFSDTGNNGPLDAGGAAFVSTFGYDPDRWTHAGGALWVEGLAAGLGASGSASASSDGGNNYAVGGARADELAGQIALFDAAVGGSADAGALYVVLAGGNDMLQGQDAASTVTEVRDAILSLSALGAEQFLVANLPNFLPLQSLGGPLSGQPNAMIPNDADVFASDFNAGLAAALAAPALAALTIHQLDLAGLLDPIIADPVGNGFSEGLALCSVDASCVAGIGTGNFLLQDHLHLSSAAHDLIAAEALAAVPEPSAALLLGLGLAALALGRRAREP